MHVEYRRKILLVCYTGIYEQHHEECPETARKISNSQIYVNLWSKQYGVQGILQLAVDGYKNAARLLLQHSTSHTARVVNWVYSLLRSDKKDPLVAEARKVAEHVADSMEVPPIADILIRVIGQQIKSKMPKAGVDLFKREYKIQLPTDSNKSPQASSLAPHGEADQTFFRSRITELVEGTRLCQDCIPMSLL